jgi:hypothetical protein
MKARVLLAALVVLVLALGRVARLAPPAGMARAAAGTPVPLPVLGMLPRAYLPLVMRTYRFITLPPGSPLPSDAECAARVQLKTENKRVNVIYNAAMGNQALGADVFGGDDPRAVTEIAPRVTGHFTGTTDMLLQWAACKWGVDEDLVRAQAAIESWWHQDARGDWGADESRCPPGHGLGVDDPLNHADQCPESWGLFQTRYPYEVSAWPGMADSSAFNADTAYAIWRACYEGYEVWLNTVERGSDYVAGDAWGCVGRWYSGRWHTPAAEYYIGRVQSYLAQRIWETPNFQEP